MKILVLNCGSSSIKYKLFENKEIASGLIEKIGEKGSKIRNHKEGIRLMLKQLLETKKIRSISEIDAIGHRVVHGGRLSKSCIINENVIRIIKKFSSVASLHNPAELEGIIEMRKILPRIPHVAVFDTAFHQTLPDYAFVYPIPYYFYKKEGIRKYGFHGISHKYVSIRAAEFLKRQLNKLKIITCHLGAGCSITAIDKGKSIDTSMGFTPLEGLMMGTRCGDIDPGILIYLADKKKISPKKLDEIFNQKSGLSGISGIGKDIRDIIKGAKKGNKRCKLALKMFCYRIKKYIAYYYAILDGTDVIVFTGGIGENNPLVRKLSSEIKCFGIKIDENKNKKMNKKEGIISSSDSKVKVLVIPTNEEKLIALETEKLVK
ncbi:MAG: acetate kinase [Candidatus Pacearchaeota archaeon]